MSLRQIARHREANREASQSTPALTLTFNRVKYRCMQSAILKIVHTIEHSKSYGGTRPWRFVGAGHGNVMLEDVGFVWGSRMTIF
jgi:hypothetical protein